MTYEELIAERPALFWKNESLEIITDEEEIKNFEKESGRKIGICYESPYNMMVVDLVKDKNGKIFAYERVVHKREEKAVCCFPVYEGKVVLLDQFRHALRDYQYAIPRGFGQKGLTNKENAVKEIKEELGADIKELLSLGEIVPDSGLMADEVSCFWCDITKPLLKKDFEGIEKFIMVSKEKFEKMVRRGEVNDGFTLSAYAMIKTRGLL